jgi:hypothetical protein
MCVDAGDYCESWVNIEYGHVFKGCGEFKNEMQGPLVWGRVLASRSVTPVLTLLDCGGARWRN